MPRLKLTLSFVTLSIIIASCTSNSKSVPHAQRTDSAGVTIVLNSGIDHPLPWLYQTTRILGGEDDGPESFYRVARHLVAFDGIGGMVVLDRSAFTAVKFTSAGEFEFAVGRQGEGPGEFERPVAVGGKAAAPCRGWPGR